MIFWWRDGGHESNYLQSIEQVDSQEGLVSAMQVGIYKIMIRCDTIASQECVDLSKSVDDKLAS